MIIYLTVAQGHFFQGSLSKSDTFSFFVVANWSCLLGTGERHKELDSYKMKYRHDSHMKCAPAKVGVQSLPIILDFPLRGNDGKRRPVLPMNILDSFFTAETQRSLRGNSIKTNRETTIGFKSTFQDFVQRCLYRADCFICRYLPANKRFFSLRPLRLCGDNSLFGSPHGAEQECI